MTDNVRASRCKVATGLSYGLGHGQQPSPAHAEQAVRIALDKAGLQRASSLILLLSHEYADDPAPALRAAARAAGTLQVIGCTGSGLLTDEQWLLDSPGAAAMVFGDPLSFNFVNRPDDSNDPVLSFCTPAGLTADWLDTVTPRIGAVSGDPFGRGPFKVWSSGRIDDTGVAEARINGVHSAVAVSQGVRALTSPIEVAEVDNNDVLKMGNYPALNVLVRALPDQVRQMKRIPLHMLMGGVTFGNPENAIAEGRYRLNHIVSANLNKQSITLSEQLNPGEKLFWAIRDGLAAERDMKKTVEQCELSLGAEPDFALLFPCMGRGPNFYGNRDRDLETLQTRYPGLPVIGFYGNGELGPLDGDNHLYQYSAVVGLFRAA